MAQYARDTVAPADHLLSGQKSQKAEFVPPPLRAQPAMPVLLEGL